MNPQAVELRLYFSIRPGPAGSCPLTRHWPSLGPAICPGTQAALQRFRALRIHQQRAPAFFEVRPCTAREEFTDR